MPPLFTVVNGDEDNESAGNHQTSGGRNKRKGADMERHGDDKKRWIKNTDQIEDFKMRSEEGWKTTFCGKCADTRPTWK
eukprot:6638656-Ditylum_brightwellii.AAC.1